MSDFASLFDAVKATKSGNDGGGLFDDDSVSLSLGSLKMEMPEDDIEDIEDKPLDSYLTESMVVLDEQLEKLWKEEEEAKRKLVPEEESKEALDPGKPSRVFRRLVRIGDKSSVSPCKGLLGEGNAVCLKVGCTTNHRGGFLPDRGEMCLYVEKGTSLAFREPSIAEKDIPEDLKQQWLSEAHSVEEWSDMFISVMTGHVTGKKDLGKIKREREVASSLKTPKRKGNPKREFPDPTESVIKDPEAVDSIQALVSIVSNLDKKLNSIISVVEDQQTSIDATFEALKNLNFERVQMKSMIGEKDKITQEEFPGASIWSAFSEMHHGNKKCEQSLKEISTHMTTLQSMVDDTTKFRMQMENLKDDFVVSADLDTELKNQRAEIIEGMKINNALIMKEINKNAEKIDTNTKIIASTRNGLKKLLSGGFVGTNTSGKGPSPRAFDSEESGLKSVVKNLSIEVSKLAAEKEIGTVKFGHLGFKSVHDAEEWVKKHVSSVSEDSPRFGLFMDAHVLMEHVIAGDERVGRTMEYFEKMAKLKIPTASEAISITSFDTQIPKCFSNNHCAIQKVVGPDSSYFDKIPTFSEWDTTGDGLKDQVKYSLTLASDYLSNRISEAFEHGTEAHVIANDSVETSVLFIKDLFIYMDRLHSDLTRSGKFSDKRAWNLTTRIAKRIFEEIGAPRLGVQGQLKTSDSKQMAGKIIFAITQSLDKMKEFMRASFADHPAVSSEYVKFLAINTGFEQVEKISQTISKFEDNAKQFDKAIGELKKEGVANKNKAEDLKTKVSDLTKRVVKIESKV